MKKSNLLFIAAAVLAFSCNTKKEQAEESENAETDATTEVPRQLYLDVHTLKPGEVTFAAVADAHKKDLAAQGAYNVNFIKYWVDEKAGKVYCLAESPDSASLANTHKEAHGLLPERVSPVAEGEEAAMKSKGTLFLDVHELGAGNVTAQAVADAHVKDLAVQGKYGVNLINYWVDEKAGKVYCLAEAKDAQSLIDTHKEAHGLIPNVVHTVQQGQ